MLLLHRPRHRALADRLRRRRALIDRGYQSRRYCLNHQPFLLPPVSAAVDQYRCWLAG